MNRIYRLIWSQARGALVAVSELASSAGKCGGSGESGTRTRLLCASALAILGACSVSTVHAQSAGDAKLADLQSVIDKYDSRPVPAAVPAPAQQAAATAAQPAMPAHALRPRHAVASASAPVSRPNALAAHPASMAATAAKPALAATRATAAHPAAALAPARPVAGPRTTSPAAASAVALARVPAPAPTPAPGQPIAQAPAEQVALASDRRRTHDATSKKSSRASGSTSPDGTDEVQDENSSTSTAYAYASPLAGAVTNFGGSPQTLFPMQQAMVVATPAFAGVLPANQPVIPTPASSPTGLIVGNGGVVGTVTQLLGSSTNSLFQNSNGYVTNGSLNVINSNFSQAYSTLSALGLPLLNLTPVGTLLTSTSGTLVGGTGINSHLTLLGGVTSGSYIDNINNGAAGGLLGVVLPGQAPAWASTCLNVLGVLQESCWGLNAAQDYQVLVGDGASANGSKEVVIGTNASHTLATVDASTAFPGNGTNDPNNPSGVPTADYESRLGHSVVIGDEASGTANAQTILGAEATSSVANSVALGYKSSATRGAQTGYAAYGLAALQNSAGEVSIGSPGMERQITNVAAGSAPTDAVNLAQLEGVTAVADSSVQYDDASKTIVTLAGPLSTDGGVTGGTRITNVQQGALSDTSTDAVNGSQLNATNTMVSNIYNEGTKYFQANSTGPVSSALGLDSVAAGPGAIANNTGDVALGANSVTAAAHTGTLAFFGGTPAGTASSVLSIGTAGNERQIQNVAPGVLAATSTDAVNGSQLYSVVSGMNVLGSSMASSLGGGSVYDSATGALTTDLSYGGGSYNSVQAVINALTGGGSSLGIKYFHVTSTLADANASGTDSVAIGPVATAGGQSSVALGNAAAATATNATAIGTGAIANADGAAALGDTASATAADALAFGTGANASMANSIALGAGASTLVGALSNYSAYGLAAPQSSTGEVNVGGRQITGVAAGSAADDAVNVAQLEGVGNQVQSIDKLSVKYDADSSGDPTNTITLAGDGTGAAVRITNLAAGAETSSSSDAINGSQLWHWTQDTSNIYSNYSLYNAIQNLPGPGTGGGSVKYFNVNSTLGDSNATGANSIAVGPVATASGTGSVAIGNGASATADNSVAIGAGSVADRDNTVSVGSAGNDRQITNVAAGTAATDAVNVGQLDASVSASQKGTVHYDTNTDGSVDYGNISLGNGGGNTSIHNVAAGVTDTDAVNVGQLNTGVQQAVNWANSYTDHQIQQLSNRANAGVAAAMAMGGLPQAYEPGKSMAAVAAGSFRGESSLAIGVSTISEGGRWVYKLTGSTDTRGDAGVSIGAGMQW